MTATLTEKMIVALLYRATTESYDFPEDEHQSALCLRFMFGKMIQLLIEGKGLPRIRS